MTKICTKCSLEKSISEFVKDRTRKDKIHPWCKGCSHFSHKKWEQNHPDINKYYRESSEKWRQNHPDIKTYHREQSRKWRAANYGKRRIGDNLRKKKRIKEDIGYRLKENLRSRLRWAILGKRKVGSFIKDLGCSVGELKLFLENQFDPGMTWGNYGDWELDHVMPLSYFDLEDPMQFKEACNYVNLRPMWKRDNRKKGASIEQFRIDSFERYLNGNTSN